MSQRHASHIRPSRRARPLRCWSICLLRLSRKAHLHPRLHLQLELDVRRVHYGVPTVAESIACMSDAYCDSSVHSPSQNGRCAAACALSSVYRTGIGAWTRFADTFVVSAMTVAAPNHQLHRPSLVLPTPHASATGDWRTYPRAPPPAAHACRVSPSGVPAQECFMKMAMHDRSAPERIAVGLRLSPTRRGMDPKSLPFGRLSRARGVSAEDQLRPVIRGHCCGRQTGSSGGQVQLIRSPSLV